MMVQKPQPDRARPAVDDRLVAPGNRYEIIDGELVYVAPADESHGSRHAKLIALLESHVRDEYDVACDMLTRTSERGDMAPDASVFLRERDPATGGRHLEELAFEIAATTRLSEIAVKAARLSERGVRRVFAIDTKKRRALEWSAADGHWQPLPPGGSITDPCLVTSVPVAALADASKVDDASAAALLAKNNRVIAERIAARVREGHEAGVREGRAAALVFLLERRGLEPTPHERAALMSGGDAQLGEWLSRAAAVATVAELLATTSSAPPSAP